MTSSIAIIPKLAIRYGLILTAVLLVGGSVIGYLVAGVPGLVSAVIGAVLTVVFMGFTAGSILLAVRVTKGDSTNPAFYGIVLGTLTLKLVVFIVLIFILRGQDWLQPTVLGVSMIVAVVGVADRRHPRLREGEVPYVDVELPGQPEPSDRS